MDIAVPEVLIGGLLGVMMVFAFVGLSVAAVGRTAMDVVKEVRRQFHEHPEIMEFKVGRWRWRRRDMAFGRVMLAPLPAAQYKPDYFKCVAIVTEAALREMRLPGLLAVSMPVATGLLFRFIGAPLAPVLPLSCLSHGVPAAPPVSPPAGEYTNRPLLGVEVLLSFLMLGTVSGILMALFLGKQGGGGW